MKNKLMRGKQCIGQSVVDCQGNIGTIIDMFTLNDNNCMVKISYSDATIQTREKFAVSMGRFKKPEKDVIHELIGTGLWRRVYGYENYYIINASGEMIRISGTNKGRAKKPYIRPNGGYATISMYKDGKKDRKLKFIHRLVAETFIRPLLPGEEINHIDGNRSNNSLYNLEIVTKKENNKKYMNIEKMGISSDNIETIKSHCHSNKINLYDFIHTAITSYVEKLG